MQKFIILVCITIICGCSSNKKLSETARKDIPFRWENATIYFLLTDRFNNGNRGNDFKHPKEAAPYRGFMGGDVQGITDKIEDGYFNKLGVDAIWMTPFRQFWQAIGDAIANFNAFGGLYRSGAS